MFRFIKITDGTRVLTITSLYYPDCNCLWKTKYLINKKTANMSQIAFQSFKFIFSLWFYLSGSNASTVKGYNKMKKGLVYTNDECLLNTILKAVFTLKHSKYSDRELAIALSMQICYYFDVGRRREIFLDSRIYCREFSILRVYVNISRYCTCLFYV